MMNRRSLMISAAAAMLCPVASQAETTWSGVALGAEVKLSLSGPMPKAQETLTLVRALLDQIEDDFSLYRPLSQLSRLNRGERIVPTTAMQEVFTLCTQMHRATSGRFDPSVQPMWEALAKGQNPADLRDRIGWVEPTGEDGKIGLLPGQKLTLNGIAQGYATDRVRRLLKDRGYSDVLIQMGEVSAIGGPFRLGLADPETGILGHVGLQNKALAVSSPRATLIAGQPHILSPRGEVPLWSTVAVEAESAAVADALSTGFTFAPVADIRRAKADLPQIGRVWLVTAEGDLLGIEA